MITDFYYCGLCGNVFAAVVPSGVVPSCCSQPMKKLVANTVDASHEHHLPHLVFHPDHLLEVNVGVVPHPMTDEHSIRFVAVETLEGIEIRYLSPNDAPRVSFRLSSPPLAVYAYCNVHGLWKKACPFPSCKKPEM